MRSKLLVMATIFAMTLALGVGLSEAGARHVHRTKTTYEEVQTQTPTATVTVTETVVSDQAPPAPPQQVLNASGPIAVSDSLPAQTSYSTNYAYTYSRHRKGGSASRHTSRSVTGTSVVATQLQPTTVIRRETIIHRQRL